MAVYRIVPPSVEKSSERTPFFYRCHDRADANIRAKERNMQ
jgi:hypothetical protein